MHSESKALANATVLAGSPTATTPTLQIDLSKPRFDQSTFDGRLNHFFATINPMNVLASDADLDEAKRIVEAVKADQIDPTWTEDKIWEAKTLYDSAYHPETGEKVFLPGRMSFQVPGNMTITGFMMTFYKSTPAVIFWQWVNQSFNAMVNYCNRNASVPVSNEQLGAAYVAASTASVATAVGLNKFVASTPALANGIFGRFVPLVAVSAANCVNIPLMRQREMIEGITVKTSDGIEIGASKVAAQSAVAQVVPSRILMAVPGMFLPPLLMSKLETTAFLKKRPFLAAPMMVGLTG